MSEQPLLNVEQSEGSRIELVGSAGPRRVNFTWTRTSETGSWMQAALQCQTLGGSLPRANEMRYFYKTLRSDDAPLRNQKQSNNLTVFGVNFYLADVLEATMDYPNTESGERMCLVVEKRPNAHVNLAEISAVRSCFTPVNLLVCRFALDGIELGAGSAEQPFEVNDYRGPVSCDPQSGDLSQSGPQPAWIIELKKRAEFQDHHVCFKPTVFYTVSVLCGLIVVLTLLISSALVFRHQRLTRRLKRAQNRDEYLIGAPSVPGSEAGTGPTGPGGAFEGLDTAGSMDILADSAFYRAPGSGPHESYKQAIIQDGYQKLANGAGASGRSGTRSVRGVVSPWSSARGIGGSMRKSHGRSGTGPN
ncbi:unnamed protein product [Echinostoma caproni]|uniref:SRCR domain-containing protein n=1 Tax=Echinostoma caproni TaxID=27848 RepID=A0A183AA81_9TREM|nr:unnamed protein product [Echinostoma caproni]